MSFMLSHKDAINAECHYAECRYAECRGAFFTVVINYGVWQTS